MHFVIYYYLFLEIYYFFISNKNFQNCKLMLYQGFNPGLNKYIYEEDAFLVYVLVAFTAIPSYKKITAQSLVVYTLKCDV